MCLLLWLIMNKADMEEIVEENKRNKNGFIEKI